MKRLLFSLLTLAFLVSLFSGASAITPVTMILAGVVVNIVTSALISFSKFYFEESLSSIVFWLRGGFFIVSWTRLGVCTLLLVISFILLQRIGLQLNLLGALLLMLADAGSRAIIPGGAELPVGIITALLGGIFFLYLLRTRRERLWHGCTSA